MVLFGIEFSPAEAVLLGIGILLILMMAALLRKGAPRAEQAAQPQEAPAAKPAVAPQQAEEEELIAVITAAAAAAMGKQAEQIHVTSCREVQRRQYAGRSAWSRAGRAQQVNRYI